MARGLAESRTRAQALILAGVVFRGEERVEKAGDLLSPTDELHVRREAYPYVSRGGVKLAGALDALNVDPAGCIAADFGASTGGFTDVLLRRGAARVYAIDVGYGQLHSRLTSDPRVVVMDRTNARYLDAESLSEPIDLVVIDASFISATKLLPAASLVLRPEGLVLAMVKPQFEVGREHVGKGGIVRDSALRQRAVDAVMVSAQSVGLSALGQAESELAGRDGNVEVFVLLRRS